MTWALEVLSRNVYPLDYSLIGSVSLQFSYDASPTQFKFLRLLSKEGAQDVSHECLDNAFDLTLSSFNGQKISSLHSQCKVRLFHRHVFHRQTGLAMAAMLRKQNMFVCLESHIAFAGYMLMIFVVFCLETRNYSSVKHIPFVATLTFQDMYKCKSRPDNLVVILFIRAPNIRASAS